MNIIEVVTPVDVKLFNKLPSVIYNGDKNYMRPLDKDIAEVFDPLKNKFFRHGTCTRFIVLNEHNHVLGRIAVFVNERTAIKEKQPTGGIGFFECIHNQDVADLLFETAKQWLTGKGMQAMDGPINFGERDSWWGLITEGFSPVQYKMNYNPPYYQQLFESYGFQTWFEQWCYGLDPMKRIEEKFYNRHAEIAANPHYRAEHLRKQSLDKYAEDFRTVYNKAWAKHGGGKELESKHVKQMFTKMKPVIDEKIIWFVYYRNEPVAMWINLPDINQLFGRFNGKFGWFQKLQFIYMLKRRYIKKFVGLVFGVVPEHQGKGVDAFMIVEGAALNIKEKLYTDYEMQWIGDFNPKMISIAESLGTHKTRVMKTYRYLFDRNQSFERHPML